MADEAKETGADVEGLRSELTKMDERAKRFESLYTDLEKKFKKYEGKNIEKLQADSEALTQLMREKATTPEDVKKVEERIEKQVREAYQKQLDDLATENKTYKGKLHEHLTVDRGLSQIGKKFTQDSHKFIKQMLNQCADQDEEGNIIIKDDKGNKRYSKSKPREPMSLAEWAEEVAAEHPSIVAASVSSGSKTPGQTRIPGGDFGGDIQRYLRMTPQERNTLPPQERQNLARQAVKLGLV